MYRPTITVSSLLCALTALWALSASTLAEIKSPPTSPVLGHAPVPIKPALIHLTDLDGNGYISVGDTLRITWKLTTEVNDPDGDTLKSARFEWFANGELVGTNYTLPLVEAYQGKKITANVYAQTDPTITEPFESTEGPADIDPVLGLSEIIVPVNGTLLDLKVTGLVDGYPLVGTPLTAEATCVVTCSTLAYTWRIESAVGSGSYTVISGATSNTYTPVRNNQKRHIEVTAKNI